MHFLFKSIKIETLAGLGRHTFFFALLAKGKVLISTIIGMKTHKSLILDRRFVSLRVKHILILTRTGSYWCHRVDEYFNHKEYNINLKPHDIYFH